MRVPSNDVIESSRADAAGAPASRRARLRARRGAGAWPATVIRCGCARASPTLLLHRAKAGLEVGAEPSRHVRSRPPPPSRRAPGAHAQHPPDDRGPRRRAVPVPVGADLRRAGQRPRPRADRQACERNAERAVRRPRPARAARPAPTRPGRARAPTRRARALRRPRSARTSPDHGRGGGPKRPCLDLPRRRSAAPLERTSATPA